MEQTQKRHRLSTGDRAAAIALAALVVATLVASVLKRFHLSLIQGELNLFMPLLAAFLLAGWGVSALVRRIKNRTVKLAVGALLGMAALLAAMIAFTYVSFIATVTLPQAYATKTSPSGKYKLVVMRSLDANEDRVRARQAARLKAAAAEGEGSGAETPAETGDSAAAEPGAEAASGTSAEAASEAEITVDDWGYVYTAYPRVARFFYRDDADVEGEAVIGYSSAATLMVEWAADESQARFYVQDPGVGDGGEVIVRLGGK